MLAVLNKRVTFYNEEILEASEVGKGRVEQLVELKKVIKGILVASILVICLSGCQVKKQEQKKVSDN